MGGQEVWNLMKVLKVRWWGTGSLELDESLEGEVVGDRKSGT